MFFKDAVYGSFEVTEPVLVALAESKPVQRLKRIEQFGLPRDCYHFPSYSRYEHSVGVMRLLQTLGASVEEQAAGLLHDVSHTAFSHVVDWVLGDPMREDYHEGVRNSMVRGSEIPSMLSRFGFSTERVLESKNYPLLERSAPDLCADRIDYALREFHYWANPGIVKSCIESLVVNDGKIVFASKQPAEAFGCAYMKCQAENWGGAETMLRYHLFSRVLKEALDEGKISVEDFCGNDGQVMEKLAGNPLLEKLKGKLGFAIGGDDPQFTFKKKFRYVDPQYLDGGRVLRLSEEDGAYRELLEEQKRVSEKGTKVRLCQ